MLQILSQKAWKNPTPRQTVVLISVILSLVCGFGFLILILFVLPGLWWMALVAAVLVYVASTYIIGYLLGIYIFRKQKMVYKTIHQRKLALAEKREVYNADEPIFESVLKEIDKWSDREEGNLQTVHSWQEYRRKYLGDISHELKTPIFNIQGYIESLIDGAMDDPQVAMSFLIKASKNLDRLNTIVQDLESISRLESDQLILDLQAFDIKELTKEVFEDLELKAGEKNIKLVFKAGADSPFVVKADRDYIRQTLMNLIGNSIKYGVENGMTKVSFYDMDTYLLVEVSDNGIGIPKEHLPRLFDRFYKVDKSRSREQGGSGLGLSIVKHIMEAHRSNPGVGSTFGFSLEKLD